MPWAPAFSPVHVRPIKADENEEKTMTPIDFTLLIDALARLAVALATFVIAFRRRRVHTRDCLANVLIAVPGKLLSEWGHLQMVFRSWNVDCEYNREGKDLDTKTADLPDEPGKTIFPDIIVHRRGKSLNLLIIEAKPSDASAKSVAYDRKKLAAYMDAEGKLAYKYGLMLTFIVGGKPDVTWEWQS
jgi:hypothetical protein